MSSSSEGEYEQWVYPLFNNVISEPPDFQLIVLFGTIAVLLFFSALFSGAEVAYFSLSHKDIDSLREGKSYQSKLVVKLLRQPKYLLSTLLISNNLVNVGIVITASFTISLWIDLTSYAAWITFLVEVVLITSLILLIGEIAPKVLATKKNKQLAKFMSIPIFVLKKVFYPLNLVLVSSTQYIENRLKKKGKISAEELNHAIDLTIRGETSSKEERKILKGLVKFGNITVKQIMKNRMDVTAIDIETEYPDLLKIVRESGYSRIPVYEESIDQIKGVLYTKDLLKYIDKEEDLRWQNLVRKPFFVPENKKVGDLLKEFQEKKVHLAIVVDEYGGTLGIVTLEDVLEEIVGDITDEFDEDELNYVKVDENNYVFEGKTLISDVIKALHLEPDIFDEIRGEADSLAGLILEFTGKIPKFKSQTNYKNFTFTIESVGKNKINKVRITIHEDELVEEENK